MASQIIDFPHDNSWKESFDRDPPNLDSRALFLSHRGSAIRGFTENEGRKSDAKGVDSRASRFFRKIGNSYFPTFPASHLFYQKLKNKRLVN